MVVLFFNYMKIIKMIPDNTYSIIFDSPIGKIGVSYDDDFIYKIYLENVINFTENYKQNLLSNTIITQFREYFSGSRKQFNLPYKLQVREFSAACLSELLKVQYGNMVTYKELAVAINNPKSARAIGNAMNKNPLPILIPCHRVVGSTGKLVGFRGGLEMKQWLLDFEKKYR